MRRDEYRVFAEGRIAHLVMKNRLIRSATYEGGMTEDGRVTGEILNLYRNLARGGVGAISTGAMAVMLEGKGYDRQICIYDERHVAK